MFDELERHKEAIFLNLLFGSLVLSSSPDPVHCLVDLILPPQHLVASASSRPSLCLHDVVELFARWTTLESGPPPFNMVVFEAAEGEKERGASLPLFLSLLIRRNFENALRAALASVSQLEALAPSSSSSSGPLQNLDDDEEEEDERAESANEEQRQEQRGVAIEKEEGAEAAALERCENMLQSVRSRIQSLSCVSRNILLIGAWEQALVLLPVCDPR